MSALKTFREMANISRAELAFSVGLKTAGAIEHYEASRRTPPLETARKIVAVLNAAGVECSLDNVFPPEKPKKRRAA